MRPLVHLVDAKGVARLCPLLEIDRLRGTEEGARWVLAPSDARLDAATIRKAVERALEGASELDARPVRAAVEAGRRRRSSASSCGGRRRAPGEVVPSRARVTVRSDAGAEVFAGEVELTGPREMRAGLVTRPYRGRARSRPLPRARSRRRTRRGTRGASPPASG